MVHSDTHCRQCILEILNMLFGDVYGPLCCVFCYNIMQLYSELVCLFMNIMIIYYN